MNPEPIEKVSRSKSILAMDDIEKHAKDIIERIKSFRSDHFKGYPLNIEPTDIDFEDLFFDLNDSIGRLLKWYECDIYY